MLNFNKSSFKQIGFLLIISLLVNFSVYAQIKTKSRMIDLEGLVQRKAKMVDTKAKVKTNKRITEDQEIYSRTEVVKLTKKQRTKLFPNVNSKSANHAFLQSKRVSAAGDTLFFQDFEGGTWPSSLQLVNKDGRTPNINVADVNAAWVLGTLPTYNGNTVARSTSWYNPIGQADDWMITPPITIGNDNYELKWKARSVDGSPPPNGPYLDGYEVRLCTNCPANITAPNLPSSMPTVLFSIPAEVGPVAGQPPVFQNRKINLSNYKNQTIRLSFRNNSNDKYLLDVDDILVVKIFNNDLGVVSLEGPTFPCALTSNESIKVKLKNETPAAATAYKIELSLNGTPVDTIDKASLAGNASDSATFTGVNLSNTGTYQIKARIIYGLDENLGNNSKTLAFEHVAPIDLNNAVSLTSFEENENLSVWTTIDANNDAAEWTQFITPGTGFAGDAYYAFPTTQPTTNIGNDWLSGGNYLLQKDSAYQLEFYLNSSGTVLHDLEVKLGRSINPDSMTISLLDITDFEITGFGVYKKFSALINVAKTGTYFLGFHATSPVGSGRMRIDAIKLRKAQLYDLAVNTIISPTQDGYLCGGTNEKVTFSVTNNGIAPIVNGNVKIVRATLTGETIFDFVIPNLGVGVTDTFTYDAGIDFTTPQLYGIILLGNVTGDNDPTNDTTFISTEVFAPIAYPLVTDFNDLTNNATPEGWFNSEFFTIENHGKDNSIALSTNLFVNDPFAGTVDRAEIITPKIEGLEATSKLVFDYRLIEFTSYPDNAYDMQAGDSVLIQISTECGPFTTIKAIHANTHTTSTDFKREFIDLGTYANAENISIRILAKHNGATGDYYIDIDNFGLKQVAAIDLAIKKVTFPPYSQYPLKHIRPFRPGVTVSNEGFQSIGAVNVAATIEPGNYSAASIIPSVAIGDEVNANFSPNFTPGGIGSYKIKYSSSTSVNQPDENTENNTDSLTFEVTDTTYARDFGPSEVYGIGFNGGTRSILGQVFELTSPDTLSSITFWIDSLAQGPVTVKPIVCRVNNSGTPINAGLDSSFAALSMSQDDFMDWFTISTRKNQAGARAGKALATGRYMIGLIQKQNYMSLGFNFNNAAPFTSFARINGGAWVAADSVLGPCQFFIRPNFKKQIPTSNNDLSNSLSYSTIFPNPAKEELNLMVRLNQEYFGTVTIADISGKMVGMEELQFKKGANKSKISVEHLKPGFYFVHVKVGDSKITHKFIKD